jgi:hypothetical protein
MHHALHHHTAPQPPANFQLTVFYEKTTWHLNCSDIHETISLIVGM